MRNKQREPPQKMTLNDGGCDLVGIIEVRSGEKTPVTGMSIEISTIYIKERWKGIVMEQMKNIYNPSKLQISSDKCQGQFL